MAKEEEVFEAVKAGTQCADECIPQVQLRAKHQYECYLVCCTRLKDIPCLPADIVGVSQPAVQSDG